MITEFLTVALLLVATMGAVFGLCYLGVYLRHRLVMHRITMIYRVVGRAHRVKALIELDRLDEEWNHREETLYRKLQEAVQCKPDSD